MGWEGKAVRTSTPLSERIRKIPVSGGATTCPAALREEAAATLAREVGLDLPDHASRAMLAEIVEAWVLERVGSGSVSEASGTPRFFDDSNVARLLELNGRETPGRDDLVALTAEAEEWARQQARRVLAVADSHTATAEQIRGAVLQGLGA